MSTTIVECPLCQETNPSKLFPLQSREFYECKGCDLLFAVPDCTLSSADEKARYEAHQNDSESDGYIRHLEKLITPLSPHLRPGMRGIDFGAGESRTLAQILTRLGHQTDSYDPIFGPPLPAPSNRYDFLTCTEAAEHFRFPRLEFQRMASLVRPKGIIAIMTGFRENERRDPSWWYLRDQTHRVFYSRKTFEKIASMLSWRLVHLVEDVIIFEASEEITRLAPRGL